MTDDVEFPIFNASAIDDGDKWDVLAEIDFSEGGSFLLNEDIDDKHLPDILELFAAFVRFGSPEQKHTTWQKDGSVYTAIPQMFIDFAKKCRIDESYRLLRRCLRHALDNRTESLDNKTAKIVLCNGEVGIHLSTPIPASMKKDIYDGDTVLTKDKILCAKCKCKSGAQGKNRNVCVHTKPRGILLSILLAEDLAEHMLLELTSMLTSPAVETDTWNEEQVRKVKESVLTLMEASGNIAIAREAAKKDTLYDMLQPYKTGTQQQKQWDRNHKPPTADEVGPFDEMIFDSPEQKAVEDGTYHSKAGYIAAQKKFQEADLVDGKVIKFHNILDRGYRGNVTAFRADQDCLQPPSSRSDMRFTGKQTIHSGAVARDRSGNERGVRAMKRSGLFSRGFKESMSAKRFSDALLTWGLQVNFMYKPV